MDEKIKQPTQTRPVGSDMSMDEILSSIRKIISTEDHLQPDAVPQNDASQKKAQMASHRMRTPLSSKEQLRSLSTPLPEEISAIAENWKSPQKPSESVKIDRSTLQSAQMPASVQDNSAETHSDETSEILKTLEEIKKSLSPETLQKVSEAINEESVSETKEAVIEQPQEMDLPQEEMIAEEDDQPEEIYQEEEAYQAEQVPQPQEKTEAVLQNVAVTSPDQMQDIDFTPVHFGQDDIPDFLKKFKKEKNDVQNIVSTDENDAYNLKEVQSFEDTDDAIIELTEALKNPSALHDIAQKTASDLMAKKENIPQANTELEDDMPDVLEMLMIKSLRPILKEWVDENIADIAQKVLREELHKRGTKSRP